MASKLFAISTILGSMASCLSIPPVRRSEASPLQLRQQTSPVSPSWLASNDGNIVFVVSDDTIGFGTVIPSDVAGELGSQCFDAGVCNTQPWTMNGTVPAAGGGGNEIIVTVNTVGAYPEWSHNGLVSVFQAAVGALQTSTQTTYNPSNCATQGCVYQPPTTIAQYKAPSYMALVWQAPNGGGVKGSIEMSISTAIVGDSGLCSTFTTIGSAVVGAVNPVGGGIFSLAGLACGS